MTYNSGRKEYIYNVPKSKIHGPPASPTIADDHLVWWPPHPALTQLYLSPTNRRYYTSVSFSSRLTWLPPKNRFLMNAMPQQCNSQTTISICILRLYLWLGNYTYCAVLLFKCNTRQILTLFLQSKQLILGALAANMSLISNKQDTDHPSFAHQMLDIHQRICLRCISLSCHHNA